MNKYEEILRLFQIEEPIGYTPEEIKKAESEAGVMPAELRSFYLEFGASPELHNLQDELILPNRYKAHLNPEYLIFFNENQGVCQAAVRKSDADIPDPPVYTSTDDGGWILSAPRVSDFLRAMFGYQASICLEYTPEEFYFITPEEKEKIEQLFPMLGGFEGWLYEWNVTVYGENGGRVALMENGGEIQMNYAANSESEFARMYELLKDIGEAI